MKIILSLILPFCFLSSSVIAQPQANQQVVFLGTFSNMQYTEEHQYGFEVELWRAGDSIIGHFFHSAGLTGDAPTGLLEKVKYSPKSGELNFETRLTMGQHYCKIHKGVPSRDLYRFKGTLGEKNLVGEVETINILDENQSMGTDKLNLYKSERLDTFKSELSTYSKWEEYSKIILNFRGPKW
jgi:hypothetical protein